MTFTGVLLNVIFIGDESFCIFPSLSVIWDNVVSMKSEPSSSAFWIVNESSIFDEHVIFLDGSLLRHFSIVLDDNKDIDFEYAINIKKIIKNWKIDIFDSIWCS